MTSIKYVILVLIFLLVGCQQEVREDQLTSTLSSLVTSEPTRIASSTATLSVTFTPQQPTNEFTLLPTVSASVESNRWMLDIDPTCTPACWQGLQINEANRADVTATMSEVFALSSQRLPAESDKPTPTNTNWVSYGWTFGDIGGYLPIKFIEFGFDGDSLIHIYARSAWPDESMVEAADESPVTPQSFLATMGQPNWIYAKPFVGSPGYNFSIVFGYTGGIFVEFRTNLETSSFCLDENFDSGVARMSIGEPFFSIEDLPIAYDRYHWSAMGETQPIDEVLDISIEEVMAKVVADQSVCFTAEVKN